MWRDASSVKPGMSEIACTAHGPLPPSNSKILDQRAWIASFFEATASLLAHGHKGFEESLLQVLWGRISCAWSLQVCVDDILLKWQRIMKLSTAVKSCKPALSARRRKTRENPRSNSLYMCTKIFKYQTRWDDGTGVMRPLRMGEIQGSIPCHSTLLLRPLNRV